jgi:hypothetical protein
MWEGAGRADVVAWASTATAADVPPEAQGWCPPPAGQERTYAAPVAGPSWRTSQRGAQVMPTPCLPAAQGLSSIGPVGPDIARPSGP